MKGLGGQGWVSVCRHDNELQKANIELEYWFSDTVKLIFLFCDICTMATHNPHPVSWSALNKTWKLEPNFQWRSPSLPALIERFLAQAWGLLCQGTLTPYTLWIKANAFK